MPGSGALKKHLIARGIDHENPDKKSGIKWVLFIAAFFAVLLLGYAYLMYGTDREYRFETKYGDCFIVTANDFFDAYTLSVAEPQTDFYVDLDYFDAGEGVAVRSVSDQIIVYEIGGIQFCKDVSSGAFQLYAGNGET